MQTMTSTTNYIENLLNGFKANSSSSVSSITVLNSNTPTDYATIREYNGFDDDDNDNADGCGSGASIKRKDRENNVVSLDLNRKIKLNGGNELRIDEKNISLHLNNPFVKNYMIHQHWQNESQYKKRAEWKKQLKALASTASTRTKTMTSSSLTQSASSPQISNHRTQLFHLPTNNDIKLGNGMSYSDDVNESMNTHNAYRPKRPHSIAGVSSSMSMKTVLITTNNESQNIDQKSYGGGGTSTATTTMTYSSNMRNRNTNLTQNSETDNVKQTKDFNNEALLSPSSSSSLSYSTPRHLSCSQFLNSPSRLTHTRNTQELPLCSPTGSSVIESGSMQQSAHYQPQLTQKIPPNVVPRRSHSTPRPIQTTLQSQQQPVSMNGTSKFNTSIPQRPRSLDRVTISTLALSSARPPPVPPSRRFSQPIHSTGNQATPKYSANSTTSPSQQRTTASGVLQSSSITGMRQSATFHGQLNRHANNSSLGCTKSDNDSMGAIRRKPDRPLSYAYGTLPDQAFLENQLRIYSEQLRTITESVRKYSEQAKLLSEMKRQQQLQEQKRTSEKKTQSPVTKDASLGQSDSNIYTNEESQTPSHQLNLFLESIRNAMKDDNIELERLQPLSQKIEQSDRISSTATEAKTPSDQLRQFLDAIRSNQLPEESVDDIDSAAERFSKFKEKLENTRSKSTPNFDKFQQSPVISESFNQFSDNLRIMNEDLEALATIKTPKKLANAAATDHKKSYVNCDNNVNVHDRVNGGIVNSTSNIDNSNFNKNAMDFNEILDSFSQLTNNTHSMDAIDYLRKCSEALRQTSEQLRIASMHSNQSYDSTESSSCSTTPGSIREAVQNLLQQPRNGFQIMDDRMKIFIDILDTQSKFSKV